MLAVNLATRICANPADRARSLDIYNEVEPRRSVTPERAASFRQRSLAEVDVLVSLEGEDVGCAVGAIIPMQPEFVTAIIDVLPQHRRRGAGSALYDAVSLWTVGQGLDTLEVRVESDDPESIAFATRRGFVEAWRESGYELDVRGATAEVATPSGVEIVQLTDRPDLEDALYDVAVEAIPDVPSQQKWTPPGSRHFLEANVRAPGATHVVALGDGEVVGYATLFVIGDEGRHSMTGVKRAWRGRGVARALKVAQIAWAKEQGLTRLSATNEVRNAPMIRVNESLGYREVPGRVGLRGPLSAATP